MAASLGSLVISLVAETATFRNEMAKATAQLDSNMSGITSSLRRTSLEFEGLYNGAQVAWRGFQAFAALGVVNELRQIITGSVEVIGNFQHLAEVAGTTAEKISSLTPAARLSNTSLDDVASATDKLVKGLVGAQGETGQAAKAMSALGFSAQDAGRFLKDPVEGLYEIAKRMAEFESDGNKAAAAMLLFGKSGAQMLPFLKELGEQQQLVALVTNEQAEQAKALESEWVKLRMRAQELQQSVVAELVPAMTALVTGFTKAANESGGLLDEISQLVSSGDISSWTQIAAVQAAKFADAIVDEIKVLRLMGETIAVVIIGIGSLADALGRVAVGAIIQDFEGTARGVKKDWTQFKSAFDQLKKDFDEPLSTKYFDAVTGAFIQMAATGGQATDNTRRNLDNLGKALAGAKDPGEQFVKTLQDQVATLGFDAIALKDFQARQLGVYEAAGPLIDQLRTWKSANDELRASVKAASDEEQVRIDLGKKHGEAMNAESKTEIDLRSQIKFETETLALNGVERERAIALRRLEQAASQGLVQNYEEERKALNDLYDRKGLAQGAIDAAKETQKAWEETAKSIEKSLEDALFKSFFQHGKGLGQSLRDALESMFKTLVLRPILQPIAGGLASLFPVGAGASGFGTAAGGLGNFGGLANIGSSLFGNAGLSGLFSGAGGIFGSGAIGNSFAMSGIGQSLGLSAGLDTAGGLALTGLGATIGSIIPIIGIGLAAASLFGAFGKGGGPKGGGFASIGSQAGLLNTDSDNQRYYTPSDQDASIARMLSTVNASYGSELRALGGTGNATFGLGFDTDPNGTAGSRVSAGAVVNGRSVFDVRNMDIGRNGDIQGTLALESQRALLAALQASDLPKQIAEILNSLTATSATQEQITRVLTMAGAYKELSDLILRSPIEDALKGMTQQAQGAYGAFMAQAQAQRALMTAYTGTTAETTALAQSTQAYYAAAVQAVAQIRQVSEALRSMFGDTIRQLTLQTLDKPGQYNYLRAEADAQYRLMQQATDPQAIQQYAQRINADIQQAFGLLDPAQQVALLPQFTAYIDSVNRSAETHLQQISDTISTAAHDTLAETRQMIADAAKTLNSAAVSINTAASNLSSSSHITVSTTFTANVPGTSEVNVYAPSGG